MTKSTSWTEDERREMAHDRAVSDSRAHALATMAAAMSAVPVILGPLEKVTTYGLPSDPFVRIVDDYRDEGGEDLYVTRTILSRGYAKAIDCAISFA